MQFSSFALAALSMGSAIAGPIVGFLPFDNAVTAVSSARVIVEKQVTTVVTFTKGAQSTVSITEVKESLVTISQTIGGLAPYGRALGDFGPVPLSKEQSTGFPGFWDDISNLVKTVEKMGDTVLAGTVSQDVLDQIKPEVQVVLSTAAPITQQFLAFGQAAAPEKATNIGSLNAIIVKIQGLVLVGPLSGLKLGF